MRDIRGMVVKIVLGSFSIAALLGIVALLVGGGDFGGTQGKVMLTTLIVGLESVAVLCYLGTSGTRFAPIGALGGAVSAVPFTFALWQTWVTGHAGDGGWKTAWIAFVIAASIAQVCLLLTSARPHVMTIMSATVIAIAAVGSMGVIAIAADNDVRDWYWRIFGVIAILDVLGTITVTALSRFGGSRKPEEPALLDAAAESRLLVAASRRGVTPTELLNQALDKLSS